MKIRLTFLTLLFSFNQYSFSQELCPPSSINVFGGDQQNIVSWGEPVGNIGCGDYAINDIISIDVKTENWEPIRVEKKLREGNYIHNSVAEFNHHERKFIFKKDTIAFLENVINPYSLIYFFRTKTLTPDTSYQINIVDNKKIIPLSFQVEHLEKIKTAKGDFFANKIWPQRNDGRPFKNAGKITIWYSEEEKIPVMINLKLKFGSLNLELVEIN